MEARKSMAPKWFVSLQPTIIRVYKVAGLVTLTAILVGLISFLVSNIFYFFDHTWVRPVPLTQSSPKVVEASTALNDANLRFSQLDAEKLEIQAGLAEIDRSVKFDDDFIAEVGTAADAPKTAEGWLVRREIERARLDKANEIGRRAPLQQRLGSIDKRREEEQAVIAGLEQSPYLRAVHGEIVLAFVPYSNKSVGIGTKLYGCSWGLVGCSPVGTVRATIKGEVQDIHPHDESVQRGLMVEISLTTPSAAEEKVLFAGGKPLWLF